MSRGREITVPTHPEGEITLRMVESDTVCIERRFCDGETRKLWVPTDALYRVLGIIDD